MHIHRIQSDGNRTWKLNAIKTKYVSENKLKWALNGINMQ